MSDAPTPAAPPPAGRPSPPALAARRDQTIEQLCHVFAEDGLDMDELEDRLDRAHRATSLAELDALVQDLPGKTGAGAPVEAPQQPTPGRPRVVHVERGELTMVQPRVGVLMAVLSGTSRRGSWHPPEHLVVVAGMGGAELDFRDAVLAAPRTRITALAIMGGVDIIVPPGVRVEMGGVALLGGFDYDAGEPEPVPSDAPVIRVDGLALMGGVSVSMRLPGESGKDARRRLRQERREAHREHRLGRREARRDRRLRD